jgi:hypothetical protein
MNSKLQLLFEGVVLLSAGILGGYGVILLTHLLAR